MWLTHGSTQPTDRPHARTHKRTRTTPSFSTDERVRVSGAQTSSSSMLFVTNFMSLVSKVKEFMAFTTMNTITSCVDVRHVLGEATMENPVF